MPLIKGSLLLPGHLSVPTGEDLLRRKTRQATMMVLKVIPIEVPLTPLSRMRDAVESARVIRLIFLCFKLTFAEWIIIAHSRATVTAGDIQFPHQVQIPHGQSSVTRDRDAT